MFEALIIFGLLFIGYRVYLNWLYNNRPDGPTISQEGWEPLLPESEYRKACVWGERPFDVCPRCHSQNTGFIDSKSGGILAAKQINRYRCHYCGMEFTGIIKGGGGALYR